MAATAAPFSCVIVPPVHAPSVWKSMSKTDGMTEAPPVNGVPLMFTLIPPVEVYRQLPDLSLAASSWYCQRAFVAGFQQAPACVLQATGEAHPAEPQSASARGVWVIGPTARNENSTSIVTGPVHRRMTEPPRRRQVLPSFRAAWPSVKATAAYRSFSPSARQTLLRHGP